jgi:hypothetical protein
MCACLSRHGEHKLARPVRKDGEGEHEGGGCGRECCKGSGDEREQPEESAERDEPVEVPGGVVRERAAMPLEFASPGALLFSPVFVRLCWNN